jgi:hypothetical protein
MYILVQYLILYHLFLYEMLLMILLVYGMFWPHHDYVYQLSHKIECTQITNSKTLYTHI